MTCTVTNANRAFSIALSKNKRIKSFILVFPRQEKIFFLLRGAMSSHLLPQPWPGSSCFNTGAQPGAQGSLLRLKGCGCCFPFLCFVLIIIIFYLLKRSLTRYLKKHTVFFLLYFLFSPDLFLKSKAI